MAIRRTPVIAVLLLCLLPTLSACGQTSARRQATPTLAPTLTAVPPLSGPKGWSAVASPRVGEEGNLADVTVISANDAWAVGSFYGVDALKRTLTEHWDGAAWTTVASPNSSSVANELDAVSGDSANDVWAVGQIKVGQDPATFKNQPVIEHWDGRNWTVSPIPALPQGDAYLMGIAAVSSTSAWAVGYTWATGSSGSMVSTPLILRWDGFAWKLVASPALSSANGDQLDAVTAISANDVWAVGGSTGPLIEHWNGSRWTVAQNGGLSANPNEDGYLTSVSGDSPNDVWATGSGLPDMSGGGCGAGNPLVMEHWNGQRWSVVNFPTPAPPTGGGFFAFNHIAAAAPNNVWAVGGMRAFTVTQTVPIAEHWNGSQWSIAQPTMPSMAIGFASVAARSGAVFAVGQTQLSNGDGATVVGEWNGSQWARVASPSPGSLSNALNGVAAMSARDVWAVGDSAAGTLSEHWDGAHWSVIPTMNGATADNHLNAVAGTGAMDVWAVGRSSQRAITEHWDGSSWTLVPTPNSAIELAGVAALSARDVWAVGATGAIHWNGSAWSVSSGAPQQLISVAAVSSSDVWAVGGQRPQGCGGVSPAIIAHWNGRQWSSMPNMPQGVLQSVSAVSSSDVWAVGGMAGGMTGGLIMRWDGRAWAQVTLSGAQSQEMASPQAVVARASNDVWVVGQDSHGQLSILHWDGHTWTYTPIKSPGKNANQFTGVATDAAGDLWAVGWYSQYYTQRQALIERYIA